MPGRKELVLCDSGGHGLNPWCKAGSILREGVMGLRLWWDMRMEQTTSPASAAAPGGGGFFHCKPSLPQSCLFWELDRDAWGRQVGDGMCITSGHILSPTRTLPDLCHQHLIRNLPKSN